jgi:hypothetical protein
MADQDARRQLGHLRLVARHGSGEDVDFHTPLSEPPGDLDDVDVESPGVAGPRLLEWRCVNADSRDTPWKASRHVASPPEQTNP